jgi:hydrogenase-4 component H
VPEGFRGIPRFDPDVCMGCGACAVVCPAKDIEVSDEVRDGTGLRRLTIHYDDCIFCAQCARNCPAEKGVVMTQDFDLATGDRHSLREKVEKELVLCELCGDPVAAKEHLLWIARRVGPAAYSNPTLMLAMLNTLSPAPPSPPEKRTGTGRGDRIRILCSRCRRGTTLEFSLEK